MSRHAAGPGQEGYREPPPAASSEPPPESAAPVPETGPPRRKRVVLADSRAPVTVLRTVLELEEQTSWAEEVVRHFIRTQFVTAIRLAALAAGVLCSLPLLFFLLPGMAEVTLAGVSLPWLLLGVLPFQLLFGVGYRYNVLAERHERDFVDMVEK